MKKSKIHTNEEAVIKLSNVSKKYFIHHEKPTFVEKLIKGRDEAFFALKNVNLKIRKGEKVGFIGSNGSGKTTLLKVIAGITSPTKGRILTKGKIVSLIDVEAGFHPDLSGIQNIYLNGMLLGMGKSLIEKKLDDIIEFADIGKFIDIPLFTYSEGMKLRLGFSIAVNADPEILILDENIAVGDLDFSKKSYAKIQEFYKKGITIILVSHFMDFLKLYCDRIVWLENGAVRMDGNCRGVIRKYEHR